jgi:hypothetical protein
LENDLHAYVGGELDDAGLIEVVGAALLWLPGRQNFGAAVPGGTMVGAVLTHLFILGPSVLPAIVLGLVCAAVLYLHRTQVPAILGRNTEMI